MRANTTTAEQATGPSTTQPTTDAICAVLAAASERRRRGHVHAPAECAEALIDWAGDQPTTLANAAGELGATAVRALSEAGWLPRDLVEITKRRLDEDATTYTVDTIAAEYRRHPEPTVDDRLLDQLSQLDAHVWWPPADQHLYAWGRRHRRRLAHTLAVFVELLALWRGLPALPVIAPPPGQALAGGRSRHRVDQRVLSKVRALLAKAEATEFPDEAEALSAKAQELVTRHSLGQALASLDRAASDSSQRSGPNADLTTLRLWLDSPYLTPKAMLVDAVATANRSRTVLHGKLGFVAVIGHPTDVDFSALLATSLLVQATRAMVAAGGAAGGRARSRSYRQSFLVSYATRIGERLAEADQATAATVADDDRLLPIVADRRIAADNLVAEHYPSLTDQAVRVRDSAGWSAGRAAADLARLHPDRSAVPAPNSS